MMSEDSHETKHANDAATEADESTAATEAAASGDKPADAEAKDQAQAAEFRERYLRAAAELENFRRRAEKERQDTAKFAIASFARDMLTMLDNLRRGLETVSADDRKAIPQLEALASGMELTEREMLATLERHGIEKVDPKGEPFDHNFHQAMMEVEDPSVPAGTVAQVMQAGYVINGRLLRPAMVAVAKGGAKDPKAAAEKVQAPIANEDVAQQEPAPEESEAPEAPESKAAKGDGGDADGPDNGDRGA